jgi:hypothetical protein
MAESDGTGELRKNLPVTKINHQGMCAEYELDDYL